MNEPAKKTFPAVVRWGAVLWLAVWIPAYWRTWGAANFLRFCDVAVVLTCLGLFFESTLLISSQAVAALVVDGAWTLDVIWKIIFGRYLTGGTEYMFDPQYSLWVRLLSLFHVAMPVVLLWALRRDGYDKRGCILQSGIAGVVAIASRFTNPALNVNYTFADPFFHRQIGRAPVHLLAVFAFMVIAVYMPTNFVLKKCFTESPPNSVMALRGGR